MYGTESVVVISRFLRELVAEKPRGTSDPPANIRDNARGSCTNGSADQYRTGGAPFQRKKSLGQM